jgi:hypothetical protein
MPMTDEESMSTTFRALLRLHAYRELTDEEESFLERYPEYAIKKRVLQRIGGRTEASNLNVEVQKMEEEFREGGYGEISTAQRLDEELSTLRKKKGVLSKGVEKALELSSQWVIDILGRKEFTLADLERMRESAPEKFKPIISESIGYLRSGQEEAGGGTNPSIERFIS